MQPAAARVELTPSSRGGSSLQLHAAPPYNKPPHIEQHNPGLAQLYTKHGATDLEKATLERHSLALQNRLSMRSSAFALPDIAANRVRLPKLQ